MKYRTDAVERRRFIRIEGPIDISYVPQNSSTVRGITAKNISADGFRFETHDKDLNESGVIEMKINLPETANPVHAKGRVAWKKKISLEDRAPFDVGIEFTEIEEDNKNTFLKFLCDHIYMLPKEAAHAEG